MKGLKYQLKNICRDKVCIMTFLLPVIVGIAVHLLSGVGFQAVNETLFGILKNDFSSETIGWLEENGRVNQYETREDLWDAVHNPSTQMIAVLKTDDGIKTLLSGNELEIYKVIAGTLPQLYENRVEKTQYKRTVIPAPNDQAGLLSLLTVIILVTAMFMGCTFNAMNIISEKEDGIALVNRVLPMSARSYIIQKVLLGFAGSVLSTFLAAFICIRIRAVQVLPFMIFIVLSAYISAIAGLFIGGLSEGLMTGIIYIKIIMIMFLAPPIFFYLTVPAGSIWFGLSYLLPSAATFYGLMDLLNGQPKTIWINILTLLVHAAFWSIVAVPFLKSTLPLTTRIK